MRTTECCNCLVEIHIANHEPRICKPCGDSIHEAMADYWTKKR